MSLKDWFGKGPKGDWVRMGTDGKIKGPCAREPGEGKPKCLPRSKASSMSLKDRAAAVRRKRREDPVADRSGKGGKPVNVNTHKEELQYIEEKSKPTNPALWSRAKSAARAKFDVYPSAYANGWAVRWYKKRGGGWRDVKEETEIKPHKMYKDDKVVLAKNKADHDRLNKLGYTHDNPKTKKVEEACWDGYKQAGMKKKGKKVVPNCVPEEINGEELGNKLLQAVKEMKEGKEHSWKSEGHYTKDGKEWSGPQHAHNGQVMTGEKHTADSQNLYHFKALSKDVQKKVLAKIQKEEVDYTQGCPLLEKLNPSMGIGKYIKDFKKSDAPQFKGASASKRRKMAVAAYLGAKRKKMEEAIEYNSEMGAMDWGTPEGTQYMKDNTPGESKKGNKCPKCGCRCGELPCKTCGTMISKVKEETEAGETKKKYREENSDEAPILGDYALTKQDIKELEYEADHITWQQALDLGLYDDDEIEDDIDSTDPHDDVNITEVLSVQGRLKRRFAARKNRQKLKVARNIALRRGSSPDRLKKRATRGARGLVYKRLLKGRDKSKMPPAEKARLEKMLKLYTPLMQRLAVRLLPNMRKMEISRMKNRKGGAAQKSKKYKAARPVAKSSTQKAKKFKIKK
jgi:hypothetical protein